MINLILTSFSLYPNFFFSKIFNAKLFPMNKLHMPISKRKNVYIDIQNLHFKISNVIFNQTKTLFLCRQAGSQERKGISLLFFLSDILKINYLPQVLGLGSLCLSYFLLLLLFPGFLRKCLYRAPQATAW